MDETVLKNIDAGEPLIEYRDEYWNMEYHAAVERCFGAGLARVAEAVFYCRIPIDHVLDIGTGAGRLLDAIKLYLPSKADRFFGVEKFPPKDGMHTESPNYYIGGYDQLKERKFQCGVCIEVVEHLTPKMLVDLFQDVAKVSSPGALYLLNSGFAPFVEQEDLMYLDPFVRGHIVSYSVEGLKILLEPLGYHVIPVTGKNWLIAIEYQKSEPTADITQRIWTALPENLALLKDDKMGSVLKILGLESARAYV